MLGGQKTGHGGRRHPQREPVAARELVGTRSDRILETEPEELGGMVIADETSDGLRDLADRRVCRGERASRPRRHRVRAAV